MFLYNFKYEFKLLIRNKWLPLLSLVFLVLFLFAANNGKTIVEKRKHDIEGIKKIVADKDEAMLQLLDSVEKGLPVNAKPWTIPNRPMTMGGRYPRIAAMPPGEMAAIAVGQSDLFSHYIQPKATGDDFALDFTEMTSPIQLLFGSFDMAFVIIYLLPLIIIAFSYNVLSEEKERGSLRLLASQPISIYKWILQKMGLRFFWVCGIAILAISIAFVANGISIFQTSFLVFIGLILAYALFWFALSFLINLLVGSSAKNAMGLIGLWVVLVLLIPSTMNQLGNSFYPVPSRSKMINETRELKTELSKKQDEILDSYLRDHPEYATEDGSYGYWHKYIAAKDLVEDELAPFMENYESQLAAQQSWVKQWRWISPALVVHQELNALSGNATSNYESYKKQVIDFSKEWRAYFIPMLYEGKSFKTTDYKTLPSFTYVPLVFTNDGKSMMLLLVYCVVIATSAWFFFRKKMQKGTAILNN